jgi:ribosomal protein S18 acetylase RimI-like enzyme
MVRKLAEPIPEPQLPQGFIIRPVSGTQEAEAIASTHRAAFGTEYMTIENRLAIMNTSEYDPSLDLVAVAPDGTIAAYCTCSVNETNKEGSTDPVATHPQFQRMGLARALLLTGMKILKERGMETACLGTSGANLAMQKTAESVGFHVDFRVLWFEKKVTQAS